MFYLIFFLINRIFHFSPNAKAYLQNRMTLFRGFVNKRIVCFFFSDIFFIYNDLIYGRMINILDDFIIFYQFSW